MNRLESMSVLVAVVKAGGFSAASRQLRMPLPTVSRKVSELEAHLKARLLVRSTRKLALTEAGETYLSACQRILAQVDEAERGASGEYRVPRGDLALTAPVVFGRLYVLPLVTEFLKLYPEVDARLLLTDRPLDLIDEHLDLAVRIGALPDSRQVALRIGAICSVVCASPKYLKARGNPRNPTDLRLHDCISFTALTSTDAWSFRDGQAVQIHSRLTVNTAEAAIDAAADDLGIARVLSYQAAAAVRSGSLTRVLKTFEPPLIAIQLVRTNGSLLTAKLRAFLDFAAPRLRKRLRDDT